MSSRRLMTRSNSGEGRSSYNNGDEGNGTSRPASRSYLSSVRPENRASSHRYSQYRPPRSTLCSVMAQLTEETQPLFETTLKSRAVSETCNVKFTCVVTGYPTPEITWYKDDMQLDRYCGLPKYEIFRNGQNHSLHIYNCTVDDAAIYQASAGNTKGIVSCSGVLEVGIMSEYKIHQRYFAKIKQKAENKRRELEGKENQGPGDELRTISPDRSQRKRRSPMEASFSAPSSMEDEGIEENGEGLAAEVEARLQGTAVGQVEEKPVPITNGQDVKENGNKGLYVYDSTQKSFIAHQPKTPFAKKKIKISNGLESVNADTLAGMVSEERGAPGPTQSDEVMEVEDTVYPSAVPSNRIQATENCQKAATEKALLVTNVPVATEQAHMKGHVTVPSHKEMPVVPIPPVPKSSTVHKETPVVPIPPVPKSSTVHKETPVVPIHPVSKSSIVHKEQSVVPIPPVPKSSTVHKETPVVPIHPVSKSSIVHKEQSVVPITPVPKSSTVHKETPVVPIHPVPKSSTLHKEQSVVPIPPVRKSSTLHKETPVVPITPVPKSSTVHEMPVVPIPPVPKSSTLHKETPIVPITPVPKSSSVHKDISVVPITPVPKSSTVHKDISVVPIPPVPKSSSVHKDISVVPITPVPKSSTVHNDISVVPITPVPKSSTLHKETPFVPITPVPKSSSVHKDISVVPITPVPKSSTVHKDISVVPITPVPKSSTVHKDISVVPITPVPKSSTVHKEMPVVPIPVVPIPPVRKSSTLHKETPVVTITPVPKSSSVHKDISVVPITPVPKSSTVHKDISVVPITPVPKSSTVHKDISVVPITPVPKSSTVHEMPVVPIPPVSKSSTPHKETPVVPITPVPKSSTVHKDISVVPITPVPKSSTVHKEQSVVPITPVPKSSTLHKETPVVPLTPVPKSSTVHKDISVVPITPVPKSSTVHKEMPVVPIIPVPKSSSVHKEMPVVPIPLVSKSSTVHKEMPVVPITPVPKSSSVHKETPLVQIPLVSKSSTPHKETPVVPITPVPKSSTVHKETPVVPIAPVPMSSTPLSTRNVTSSDTQSKQPAKLQKDLKVRHNEKVESPSPPTASSRLSLSPVVTDSTVREDVSKTQQEEDVTVMDIDEKPLAAEPQCQTTTPLLGNAVSNRAEDTVCPQNSKTSIRVDPVCVIGSTSKESPHSIQDASPRSPREMCGRQPPEAETTPGLRNASASRPPQLGEVAQPCAQAKRNDAPVKREAPPTRCELDLQSLQRPPSGKEAMADGSQTPTLYNTNQSAADAMTQSTGGSNDSHAVLFTGLQTERQSDGKNTVRCNISPAVQQSHVEIAIKTVEGTEIQVDKKVEGDEEGRLKVHRDNLACAERRDEVENQVESQNRSEQVKIEQTTDAGEKEVIGMTGMDVSYNEMEKNVPVLKRTEEIPVHPKSQKHLKPTEPETIVPVVTKNRDKANSQNANMSGQQIETFKEIPTPVSKVVSIAELLRAQLKALGAEPLTAKSQSPVDNAPRSTPSKAQQTSENSPEIRTDLPQCRLDPEKPQFGREMEARVDASPHSNIDTKPEHKLVHSPNAAPVTVTAEHRPVPSLCVGATVIDALPFVIPPISVIDMGNSLETKAIASSTVKDIDSVMDTGQESGASPPVPLKDDTSASLSETENVQIDFSPITPKEDLASAAPPASNPPAIIPPEQNQSLETTVVENGHSLPAVVSSKHGIDSSVVERGNETHVQSGDLVFTPNLNPEMQLISEAHVRSTHPGSTEPLDQHKDTKPMTGGSETMQTLATESALGPETQESNTPLNQQDDSPSMIEEYVNSDSSTPFMDAESNPLLRKGNGTATAIPAATPRELASGARRKIFIPKPTGESSETTSPVDAQPPREEGAVSKTSAKLSPSPGTPSASPGLSRRLPLLQPPGQRTPPAEKRSPLLSRKKVALETPPPSQESSQAIEESPKTEDKPAKDKHDPFKAPQVIRKIRGEPFSDALGHLKLWCQFFNVLSDSTIKWYRDEVEIAEVKRSAGDETQVALAIVQASSRDCGVYGCTITNEYGTDSTDILLSVDILSGMFLREDLEVGEEIEMTPLLFNKGLVDSGVWGNKFFGRVMIKESHVGDGSSHKAWRAKVIYGLEPVFESGNTCIIKVRNPIAYGGKEESNLVERNLTITQQECRIQNMAREYCKIFSAEARVIENFGESLEVIPVYMMYRPASTIPHATVETDLQGIYLKYCLQDAGGRLVMRASSKVEQKCCALQHWVHQWTNGNLLLTRLEGVDTKITNVGISIKTTGYQGLSAAAGNPAPFEQFVSQHQCNYYCGLLSLRSLKAMDSLQTPAKAKSSRSPLLHRKVSSGSSSPQTGRKAAGSPRSPRKSEPEPAGGKALTKPRAADAPKVD